MLELFLDAGWVSYPLGLCSILALGILLERAYALARLRQLEDRAFAELNLALQAGPAEDGEGIPPPSDPRLASAPVYRVLDALQPLLHRAGEETLLQAGDIALSLQRLRLRRYLSTLATIGSMAPFIGLFGTVLGVMTAFEGMSKSGLSNETMAAGISEALSATALGLLVAIPSVVAYNYFVGRVQAFVLHIHGHVARLVPLLRQAPAPPAHPAAAAVRARQEV
jgi:biopolymer transport protein ExbB